LVVKENVIWNTIIRLFLRYKYLKGITDIVKEDLSTFSASYDLLAKLLDSEIKFDNYSD